MPVCAGRPDNRPCPDNKKDSSVKFSICDLFLCKACYDFRKPLTIVGDNTQSAMSSKAACMIPTTPSAALDLNEVVVTASVLPIRNELLCFV